MSIGIIGGADGPTAIFVSSSAGWIWIAGAAAVVAAGIAAYLFFKRR